MDTLVLEVRGEYGQFKKPYSPMSPVSYPFPPPPTVLGMLGAIAGYPKADYARRLGWERVRVGVRLLEPVRTFRAALNLLQTKDGTDGHFRPKGQVHSQVPYEFLRRPAFRLYVAGLPERAAGELADWLTAGRSAYTVTLGPASCLGEVAWVGAGQAVPLAGGDWSCATVVSLGPTVTVDYQPGRRYQRLRVPAVMDEHRIVHRYQEVVLADDGLPLRGQAQGGIFHEVLGETVAFL